MVAETNQKTIIANFILTVGLLLVSARAYQFNWQYSPRKANIIEVIENANDLIGKRVLITGYANSTYGIYYSSFEICSDQILDIAVFIADTQEYDFQTQNPYPGLIEIDLIQCSGSWCDYSCSPIKPTDFQMYSFFGTLVMNDYNTISEYTQTPLTTYKLVDIDLARSSQLVDGRWQKLIPGNYVTQKIIIDPETGEQIYP